ncbi:A disintegrin and metalloproteinase with thrombospondin motifs 2 [Diachasma alloeum]|uniref:A disintegrin and metalloproteinase with thrombospondin motifs 2 n=1 Tax=Diachasma alloeum TaxID=454923 RepID=UPI0007384542|nr:A disintegrin and metalloproteinase with thrombospondin motifs 2 [Diachasma alloeum]
MSELPKFSITFTTVIILITLNAIEFSDSRYQIINHGPINPKIISLPRNRRSLPDESSIIFSLGNWTLENQLRNSVIFPDDAEINYINSAVTKSSKSTRISCKNFRGQVQKIKKSSTIVTICDNDFYVVFNIGNRNFVVEPGQNGEHSLGEIKFVGVRERREVEGFWNLTGDTFEINESGNVEDIYESNGENFFAARTWTRTNGSSRLNGASIRELSQRWLELGIAVDYSVVEFHGDRVEQYVLALLNIVGAIYGDPSLGTDLSLVVVKIFIYMNKKDGMIRQGNARTSLENVNRWNRKVLSSLQTQGHDVAVWLTRLDIGGPSGYAPVSGACDPARSCALNRDEGLTSAFIIAHELAHILGLTHDGDESADNFCGNEATGSIMAPMVAATFHRFHWSSCSRKEFNRRAKQWKCLNNPPNKSNVTLLKLIHQETFTMDEQCRMEFGDGFQLCKTLNLPGLCSHLWCAHKTTQKFCKTKKGPPLEGTSCGKNKWCINGFCEVIDRTKFSLERRTNKPRDGGWSTWTPWGKCSRTCGVGVRLRYRLCNDPTPSFGGTECSGNRQEFKSCEQSECPIGSDLRKEQCSRLLRVVAFDKTSDEHKITLSPDETDNDDDKCRLTCRNDQKNKIYRSDDFFIDGTPCAYETTDICIQLQGECHKMGCDKILNSPETYDACGVCSGDNTTCIIISNKFHRRIRRVTTRAAVLPKNAHNINLDVEMNVLIERNETFKLLLRDGHRRKHEALFDSLVVEGTLFQVQRSQNRFTISAKGPTLAEVIISVVVPETAVRGSSISVSLTYLTDGEDEKRIDKYSWVPGGWGPCSVSCGGGVRQKTTACRNDGNGRIVHKRRCLTIAKPLGDVERCNVFSCDFKWIVGPWEGCTRTCGAHGIQQRQLYCVHSSFPFKNLTKENEIQVYKSMLPPNLCKEHLQPDSQQNCNRIPCEGAWVFTNWSSCSQSCGRGVQSRMARCVPPEGETHFNCTSTQSPGELRPCRGQGRRTSGCETFCKNNKSRYCFVPNLKKYCAISEFKKHCCRSCMKVFLN